MDDMLNNQINIIDGIQYRKKRLMDIFPQLRGKRIVIYGTGINAKRVIEWMESLNVVGLIDYKYTGNYLYGKKVLSYQEIISLEIDTVLIAAQAQSIEIVYNRILPFCSENNIKILDMYGCDEIKLHQNILDQKVAYRNLTQKDLIQRITENNAVLISLKNIIYPGTIVDEMQIYGKLEERLIKEGNNIPNFKRKRILAGEKALWETDSSRSDIYGLLASMLPLEQDTLKEIKNIEEELILENLFPNTNMVELIQYASDQRVDVYIYADLFYGEEITSAFLEKYGLTQCKKVLASSRQMIGVLEKKIRDLVRIHGNNNVLCFGNHMDSSLIVPQLYNANFQFMQDGVKVRDNTLRNCGDLAIAHRKKLETRAEELEKLIFPQNDNPIVSIIVSACFQFEYIYNCLDSILFNTDDIEYEVIISNSTEQKLSLQLDVAVSGITVVYEDKCFSKAVEKARGKYIVFLSGQTQVCLNWLYPMILCMEEKESVGAVGVKILYPDNTISEAGGLIRSNGKVFRCGRKANANASSYCYVKEVDYVSSTAMGIKKELWDDIGGFEQEYTYIDYRDADFSAEIRRRGKRVVYQPDSMVVFWGQDYEERYVEEDRKRLLRKRDSVQNKNILPVYERRERKTILCVSATIPTYNKDAGSKTLDSYILEFLNRNYIVKFIPADFIEREPYTHRLEQMGVEILGRRYNRVTVSKWICNHAKEIDFAFLNYPDAAVVYIDLLKQLKIPVIYYGMDLHYLRLQREYGLFGNDNNVEIVKNYLEKEEYLIQNSDAVYYPSLVEVEIVKKKFQRKDVKQLVAYIYDLDSLFSDYRPSEREGIMFVGGYGHNPNVDAMLWFLKRIYPQVFEKLKASFYMAGSNMPVELSEMEIVGVEKLGELSDAELEALYKTVKLVVVPLRYGAGIKGKVIEAMYYGVPIITTSIGIEGIPNEGDAVRIADNEKDFVKAIVELYQSEEKLLTMSKSGQEIVRRYYSREAAWNSIADDFK